MTRKNKVTLRNHLKDQLEILIDKVFVQIRKSNKDSKLKQSIMDEFINAKDIKKGIPEYAQAILAKMSLLPSA